MAWKGRQLTGYAKNGTMSTFTYDADGLRGSKTVDGVKTTYQYVGDKLYYEKRGDSQEFYYFYDSYGNLASIYYTFTNGTYTSSAIYRTLTNMQGDVVAIYNNSGALVARYEYDAWGNILAVNDANGNAITQWYHIANANPIRYRGYYYDSDLGLYYLQSRYYDAETGRFINADSQLNANLLLGYNLFAYCENNPSKKADPTGHLAAEAAIFATNFWNPVGWGAAAIFAVEVLFYATVVVVTAVATATIVKNTVEAVDNIVNTKDQSVYTLKDSNNDVRYVGRTNDPIRRANEHGHDPKHPERKDYQMTVVATGLSVPAAKVLEQVLISAYTLNYLDNARREIAVGNLSGYITNMGAVIQLFEGATEDELMNLMGR